MNAFLANSREFLLHAWRAFGRLLSFAPEPRHGQKEQERGKKYRNRWS